MAAAPDPEEVLRSTRGKGNFQRLARLLISGGTALLREVFDQICSPGNLPTILKNPATEKQLKAAKLTKPQWDCLYPSPGVYGKSADFDVTLLFRLLRTICSLTPPATGWDLLPASTDHSLAADLARIKYYRNSVYGHVDQNMEITDDEFPSLWQGITEVLVRIAGQISNAKKHEWQKAVDAFLKDPLTAEDERNAQELLRWYDNDTEVKQSIEKLKTLTQEAIGRLEKSLNDFQEDLAGKEHAIEEKGQFLENIVQEEAKDIKDQLGELKTATQNVQCLVREEAQEIKGQLGGELKTTTQNVQCLVREESRDIRGELNTATQNVQCLVREEAQEIKGQLRGELKTTTQNVQCLVREESQGIRGELNTATQNVQSLVLEEAQDLKGELKSTTQNVQSVVREEAQDLKGELKNTTQNVQSVVREEAQVIKEKLDEVHQSIDGLHSTAGSSQPAGVQIRLRMDCEAISGPSRGGGASGIATTSRESQQSVPSATVVSTTSHQQQASSMAVSGVENVVIAGIPSTQGVLNFIAYKYFQGVDSSKPDELNGFLQYMRDVRNVLVVGAQQGSLIITLECGSLEILEGLWEDYCSGHLKEMAEKYLVTDELLEEFGLTAVKLTTKILEEEYTACRQHFLQSAVYSPGRIERESATGPQVETSELSSVAAQRPPLDFWSCMPIFVNLSTGKTIKLEVEPSDTIKYVKQLILISEGIHPYCQGLKFVGEQLEDDCTLNDYKIERESVLCMVQRPYVFVNEIFIMLATGKMISLEVEIETSIRNVKDKIQHKLGITPDQQHLVFRGQALEDDRTLKSYQMANGSTLRLGLAAKQIFVKMPSGKTITLEVKPESSIRDVKCQIQKKEGISPDQQHISFLGEELKDINTLKSYHITNKSTLQVRFVKILVNMPSGKTVVLEVGLRTSIRNLKDKIQYKLGITPDQQHLTFRGQALEDDRTLKSYQMANGSTLRLGLAAKQIFVKMPSGKTITLEVKPESSIRDLKCQIQKKEGFPPDQQCIFFIGKELDDYCTLKSYHILNESILQLCFVKIFVKMSSGETVALEVGLETSIRNLKGKIQHNQGIRPDQQHLEFRDEALEDDRTLESYHIMNESTLRLKLAAKQIFVRKPSGETITLEVIPETFIRDIKCKIQDKEGIPPDQQYISFLGKELKDIHTLKSYHITNKSTLQVRFAKRKIFVKMPSGKTVALEVEPKASIRDVKNTIQRKRWIRSDQQHLKFRNEALEDDRTLESYHIADGATLRLSFAVRKIFVQMPNEKTITLEVKPGTSVRDAKIKIQDREGIPHDQQHLIFNGMELANDRTVWHYTVPNEATVHVRGMQIYVVLPTGRKTTLDVFASESVEILKEKIYKKEGIVPDQQQLIFDNTQLEDGCSLSDYNIREESALFLKQTVRLPVRIECETIIGPGVDEGPTEMVETSQEDEYGVWEAMAGSATGTTSRNQKAKAAFPMAQRVLNLAASKYLQTDRIDKTQPEEVNGFVLYLRNKRKARIVDVEPESLIITLESTTPESLEELWMDYCTGYLNEMAQKFLVTEKILKDLDLTMVTLTTTIKEQEYRDCLEYLSIHRPARFFVKTPTGNTVITLEIAPSDTVKDVKRQIMDELVIPVHQQELIFDDKKLEDDRTIDYYRIKKESTLQLNLKQRGNNMQLFVTPIIRTVMTLDVVPEDTIQTVKRKVMEEVGIPEDQYELSLVKKKLEGDYTLNDYNIRSGTTLHLALKQRDDHHMRLFVKTQTGRIAIRLDVVPEDTIQTVKSKITDEVGIPVDQYELTLDGKKLEDDHTLNDYNIRSNTTLHLALTQRDDHMQLFVKTQTAKTEITLDVLSEDTLKTVKRKIMDEVGIPINKQQFTFAEKTLEDGYTLKDYNIGSGSTLHLSLEFSLESVVEGIQVSGTGPLGRRLFQGPHRGRAKGVLVDPTSDPSTYSPPTNYSSIPPPPPTSSRFHGKKKRTKKSKKK